MIPSSDAFLGATVALFLAAWTIGYSNNPVRDLFFAAGGCAVAAFLRIWFGEARS